MYNTTSEQTKKDCRKCNNLFKVLLELLLESTDQTDDTVDCEEYTCNDQDDVGEVAKGKTNTCNDGEDREEKTENGGVILDRVNKINNALECDKNTENKKNDVENQPSAEDDSSTDYEADRTANPVLLNDFENTGNDEEHACDEHSPLQHITGEYCEKNTNYDVKDRSKQSGINFLFHDKTPFFDIFAVNIIARDK